MDDEQTTQPTGPAEVSDLDGCPAPCSYCTAPGDCEDGVDCLYWPRTVEPPPVRTSPVRGWTTERPVAELEAARAELTPSTRVGLLMRRHRKQHRLSQRALADELGWSRSAVGRAETDASSLTLESLGVLLAHIGYRVALVPDDPPDPATSTVARPTAAAPATGHLDDEIRDDSFGVIDLLAHDARRRRLPPYGRARLRSAAECIAEEGVVGHTHPWLWQQPG